MQIKQTSDYAIRIVCFLAQENQMCAASVLASGLYIPYNYIPKVIKLLKEGNSIIATEGVQGGYQLLRKPWEISLWDILSLTETTMKINNCLDNDSACSRKATSYCMVHKTFQSVQSDMEYRLQSITIAELIGMKMEEYTQSFYTDILVDARSWTYRVLYSSNLEMQKFLAKNTCVDALTAAYIEKYVYPTDQKRVREFTNYGCLSQPYIGAQWEKAINYKRVSDNKKGHVWMEMRTFYDNKNNTILLTVRDSKLVNYHMTNIEKKLEDTGCREEKAFWDSVQYGDKILSSNQRGFTGQGIIKSTELIYRKLAELYPELEIDEKEITAVSKMSVVRDIGKLQLPIEVLNKKEALNEEEIKMTKMHPIYGAEILKHIQMGDNCVKLYELLTDICLYHHERYDGGGYPEGLKGDEIPIYAQVVGIADAYESLVTIQKNGEKHKKEEAIQMILAGTCGAFSPRLLHSFVAATADLRWDAE